MAAQTVFTLVNPQTGNLAFKVYTFEGSGYFDHVQRLNYYSMILLTGGEGQLKADFSEYDFKAKCLMCFSPYQPFMIKTHGEFKGLVLNFHPDFFCIHKHHKEVACNGVLFNNIYEPPILALRGSDMEKFYALFEQIKSEMQNVEVAQYELLISYLKIFLINASRLKLNQHHEIRKTVLEHKEPFILQNLRDAIEEHYKTRHSAGDYAELLNMSAKSLAKLSKTHFNKTLTNLIAERIVIEAKRELYLTSKPVKIIAHELGFNDEYYFSRFFKTNADISPQVYRNTVGFARLEA